MGNAGIRILIKLQSASLPPALKYIQYSLPLPLVRCPGCFTKIWRADGPVPSSDRCLRHCQIPSIVQALAQNSQVEQFLKLSNTNKKQWHEWPWIRVKENEKKLNDFAINQSSKAGQGWNSTAAARPLGMSAYLHKTIWTQTNTLSTSVLLALLNLRTIRGLRDHLVQPPHFSDEKTKGWKN